MKRKNILIGSGIILVVFFTGYFLLQKTEHNGQIRQATNCSEKPPLKNLETSEPHLEKLAVYQKECHSFATDRLMFFIGFPENETAAERDATSTAKRLKKFHASGVAPIVIAEPHTASTPVSYASYLAGDYDTAFTRFFSELKAHGVTDEMMGTWVPFPESNTPIWDNEGTTPEDFARGVNKYLGELKRHFPEAKGSVLLNSMTYVPGDAEWQHGKYAGFSEYVDNLDPNLVTSFGIQGFPWTAHARQAGKTVDNAGEFLQPGLAIEAAETLGTRDIWINTGTFGSKYVNEPAKAVYHSAEERKATLEDIAGVAEGIKKRGYSVSVNLFSEDKSDTDEATDWSYLKQSDSTAALKKFFKRTETLGISVSLFDKAT